MKKQNNTHHRAMKIKNVAVNSLIIKVDKLDVDKLVPVPVDLGKLSNLVKRNVVKKDAYNAKIKDIQDKMFDTANLATNTDY